MYILPELFEGMLILRNEYWLKEKNNHQENEALKSDQNIK